MIIERIKFYKTNEVKKEIHDSGYTKYYKSGRIKEQYHTANKATYHHQDDESNMRKVVYISNARVQTDCNGNEHISYL